MNMMLGIIVRCWGHIFDVFDASPTSQKITPKINEDFGIRMAYNGIR